MRIKVFIFLVSIFSVLIMNSYSQELWTAKDGSIRNLDIRDMVITGDKSYLATINELYVSSLDTDKWVSLFFLPSGSNRINCIGVSSDRIFVGTARGLFSSDDNGKRWRTIFNTIIPAKSSVLAIDLKNYDSGKILIGTERGVFISDNKGVNWRNISGVINGKRVNFISIYKDMIFAGADDGLYMAESGKYNWQRIHTLISPERSDEDPVEADDSIEEGVAVNGIVSFATAKDGLYIASAGNIFHSIDDGRSWGRVITNGLKGGINYIAIFGEDKNFYCATSKGVFILIESKGVWVELYRGMKGSVDVKRLVADENNTKMIWALTKEGLYRYEITNFIENGYGDIEKSVKDIQIMFKDEPTFRQLQNAAIRFNEVSPDKIRQWRAEARVKALVPKISLGMDSSRSNSYEIYTSATKDYVISGPDDINEGVDVSLSWDLGNMIWSDDQSSIDVRSRLNTQLRNDILDDLRRAYYERRRLQYELYTSPPQDMKLRFEKELRIQEFTQAIDDLTGNYLSDHMK